MGGDEGVMIGLGAGVGLISTHGGLSPGDRGEGRWFGSALEAGALINLARQAWQAGSPAPRSTSGRIDKGSGSTKGQTFCRNLLAGRAVLEPARLVIRGLCRPGRASYPPIAITDWLDIFSRTCAGRSPGGLTPVTASTAVRPAPGIPGGLPFRPAHRDRPAVFLFHQP